MKFIITAHPIDKHLQKVLGIYEDSTVPHAEVGSTLEALTDQGYTQIHTHVDEETGDIKMHCKQPITLE